MYSISLLPIHKHRLIPILFDFFTNVANECVDVSSHKNYLTVVGEVDELEEDYLMTVFNVNSTDAEAVITS